MNAFYGPRGGVEFLTVQRQEMRDLDSSRNVWEEKRSGRMNIRRKRRKRELETERKNKRTLKH